MQFLTNNNPYTSPVASTAIPSGEFDSPELLPDYPDAIMDLPSDVTSVCSHSRGIST
jgi:hypothetical protein